MSKLRELILECIEEVVAEGGNIKELTAKTKYHAALTAREKAIKFEKDPFAHNKFVAQSKKFIEHINPEIKKEADLISKKFGPEYRNRIEKYKNTEGIVTVDARFYDSSGIIYLDLHITKDKVKVDRSQDQPSFSGMDVRLNNFVKKVREKELNMDEASNAMVQSKAGTTYQSYDKPQDLDKLKQDPNVKSIVTTGGQKLKEEDENLEEKAIHQEEVPQKIKSVTESLKEASEDIADLEDFADKNDNKKMKKVMEDIAELVMKAKEKIASAAQIKQTILEEEQVKVSEYGDKVLKSMSKHIPNEESAMKLKNKYIKYMEAAYKKGKAPKEVAERIVKHRFEL